MAKVMSFGVWCLTHKIFSSVNFVSGEAAMLLSLSVFVGIIANLGVFFRIDGLYLNSDIFQYNIIVF